jgi:hypothetical protein
MLTPRCAKHADYETLNSGKEYMSGDGWRWRARGFEQLAAGLEGVRWIEYGAGRGMLASYMTAAGWYWMATDPHPAAPWVFNPESIPTHMPFDWSTSIDVLEHLEEGAAADLMSEMRATAPRGMISAIANMSDVHEINGEPVELHLTQRPPEWWKALAEEVGGTATIHPIKDCAERFWLRVKWRQ